MSRIGKKPVPVPAGVKVSIKDRVVNIEGPKGKLSFTHRPEVKVSWDESEKAIKCTVDQSQAGERMVRALWGTTRAILRNMIEGVTKGYEKSMEIVGVGWNASVAGKTLKLSVGYANQLSMAIPEGVTVVVDKAIVRINGADRQKVGMFASSMRALRKPEPYNGKGIKYTTEVIKKKQGKQFGS